MVPDPGWHPAACTHVDSAPLPHAVPRYRVEAADIHRPPPKFKKHLRSTTRPAHVQWYHDLQRHLRALATWNRALGLDLQPPLQAYVNPDTWDTISQELLPPAQRTMTGQPPNDAHVHDYLLFLGQYASAGGPPKVYYHDPLQRFADIQYGKKGASNATGHVDRLDAYLRKWNALLATMPAKDIPPDKVLAKTMRNAIRPSGLAALVIKRMETGRGPGALDDDLQQWRKDAKKHIGNHPDDPRRKVTPLAGPPELRGLKDLIREHAQRLDRLVWTGSPHAGDSFLGSPGQQGTCAKPGCTKLSAKGFKYCSAQHCRQHRKDKRQQARGGTGSPAPAPAAPPGSPAPAPATPPSFGKCSLQGCNKPIRKQGHHCCSFDCFKKLKTNPSLAKPGSSFGSPARPGAAAGRTPPPNVQHRRCFCCGGDHGVLACPLITPVRQSQMEQKIGYRHTLNWWKSTTNQAKVTKYRARPDQQWSMRVPLATSHGVATFAGRQVDAVYDLGGCYTLASDVHWNDICADIAANKSSHAHCQANGHNRCRSSRPNRQLLHQCGQMDPNHGHGRDQSL